MRLNMVIELENGNTIEGYTDRWDQYQFQEEWSAGFISFKSDVEGMGNKVFCVPVDLVALFSIEEVSSDD